MAIAANPKRQAQGIGPSSRRENERMRLDAKNTFKHMPQLPSDDHRTRSNLRCPEAVECVQSGPVHYGPLQVRRWPAWLVLCASPPSVTAWERGAVANWSKIGVNLRECMCNNAMLQGRRCLVLTYMVSISVRMVMCLMWRGVSRIESHTLQVPYLDGDGRTRAHTSMSRSRPSCECRQRAGWGFGYPGAGYGFVKYRRRDIHGRAA